MMEKKKSFWKGLVMGLMIVTGFAIGLGLGYAQYAAYAKDMQNAHTECVAYYEQCKEIVDRHEPGRHIKGEFPFNVSVNWTGGLENASKN